MKSQLPPMRSHMMLCPYKMLLGSMLTVLYQGLPSRKRQRLGLLTMLSKIGKLLEGPMLDASHPAFDQPFSQVLQVELARVEPAISLGASSEKMELTAALSGH
eukprot:10962756-Karenia_brevis.AAC.1